MNENEKKYLAWFLGPKAENGNLLEELLIMILRDYIHWRKNYYPGDKILMGKKMQRLFENEADILSHKVQEMVAELKRNFPFYSPRYLAHMLSDTTMPSLIGYLAGILYNPNNVTAEAAPVTVDWEIEACSDVLEMLGYTAPPSAPTIDDKFGANDYKNYLNQLGKDAFGWAHITPGGTLANIEALWVARAVRYMPLAIWDTAFQHNLAIEVKQANGQAMDIKAFRAKEILAIKPNEAIYLLSEYFEAVGKRLSYSEDAYETALNWLYSSRYSLSNGTGRIFSEFQPVIFVSGTAHYSICKAADILGIGKDNVWQVKMDSMFRMDMEDLEKKIKKAIMDNKLPLAVIAIAGTTEEGSVDPIHKVVELRSTFEKEHNMSFWLHIDGAWGGFIRALFHPGREAEILMMLSRDMGIEYDWDIQNWHFSFFSSLEERVTALEKEAAGNKEVKAEYYQIKALKIIINNEQKFQHLIENNDIKSYADELQSLMDAFNGRKTSKKTPPRSKLSMEEQLELVKGYVSDNLNLSYNQYEKNFKLCWGYNDVLQAFMSFHEADSITVDAHKMGYIPYACGLVAFKNDRIREFIRQKAPYITSVEQKNTAVHMPPRHIEENEGPGGKGYKAITESFATFILEGSRPGAAASSLWLAVRTVPLTMNGHGAIVKSSLLSALELFTWFDHWDKIMLANQTEPKYRFVTLMPYAPDTNLVLFTVNKAEATSLKEMNALTKRVYERFSIQAELGESEYSYAQPYFLSKTTFHESHYPYSSLKDFFTRAGFDDTEEEYKKYGLTVIRITVMNPYINPMRRLAGQNLLKEFMQELAKSAEMACGGEMMVREENMINK